MTALLEAPPARRPSGRVLRPYQSEACAAIGEDWAGGVARPAIVLPTGCGKTDVIAAWATDEAQRGGRVLVLAHRTELLDQIAARCAQHDGSIRVGRVQGSTDEPYYPITVAMIQTLATRVRSGPEAGHYRRLGALPQPTLVIVDECHHAAAPGYLAVLAGLGCFGPGAVSTVAGCERRRPPDEPVRTFGVTATLVRGDDAALGDVWQSVAYARDIGWAVACGHLVRPRGRVVVADAVRLDRAKLRGGDYRDGELGKMITQSAGQIVADWVAHGRHDDGSPRTTAAFCPDKESAHALAAEFAAAGISVGVVTGETTAIERRRLYRALADGSVLVLVSVMVLTEGWDCPRVSCILQCRPTRLPGLYTQIVGRGLRPWAEHETYGAAPKTDCLILDVVGASRGQKLQTLVDLHESSEYDSSELDEALACPVCGDEHSGPCALDDGVLDGFVPDDEPGDEDEPERVPVDAPQDYAELELLAADEDWTWLRTPAGRPFIPVGDRFVFLWEGPGRHLERWSVGYVHNPAAKRWAPGAYLGHGLALSAARDLAQRWAAHEPGAALAARTGRWRRGRATPDLLAIAARWGVDLPDRSPRAAAVDAIAVAQAAAAIDTLG